MLVAVTVTLEATVPVAVSVVDGLFPVAVVGLTVPAPETVKFTPEARKSLVTTAASGSVWPESRLTPVVGVLNVTAIGSSGTVTDADRVGSFTLVAVTTAEVPATGLAAVYVVATPLSVVAAVNEPPPVTDQVTPEFELSLVTVAVNAWVAPPIMATGLAGAIVTAMGVRVTAAVAVLVGSVLLVAVTVAEATLTTAGAV